VVDPCRLFRRLAEISPFSLFFSFLPLNFPATSERAAFSHGQDSLLASRPPLYHGYDEFESLIDTVVSLSLSVCVSLSLLNRPDHRFAPIWHLRGISRSRFSLGNSLEFAVDKGRFAGFVSSRNGFAFGEASSGRARSLVCFGTTEPSRITRDRTRPRIGSKSWSYRGVTRFHPRIPRMLLAALGRLRGMSGSARHQRASSQAQK